MTDMQGHQGDFPGVLAESDLKKYSQIILDPNPFIFG
jgi:hypothetical protein